MKMGMGPYFILLSLLLSVASARGAFMSTANDAERKHLLTDNGIDPQDLVKIFENMISSFEGSPTDFSRSCLEISRKAKSILSDQSLIDEMDNLASTLCHIVPLDMEAKLRSNGTCTTCRNILDAVTNALGDTDKQLLIILYLIKACEIQPLIDQCKKLVFAFGPIVLSTLQTIVSKDICYMVNICEDPRNQTQNATSWYNHKFEPYVQSKLGNLDLM